MIKHIDIKNELWLTPEKLQEQYGFSLQYQKILRMKKNYTEEAMAKKMPIPFIKIGGRVLYNKNEIDEWLSSFKVKF